MLKSELEDLCASQQKRIDELEAEECESPAVYGYLVFAGPDYCEVGGWRQYRQCFAREEDAEAYAQELFGGNVDWAQVVELPTGRVQEFND